MHRGTTDSQFLGNALGREVTSNPESWVGVEVKDDGYLSTSLGGHAAFASKPVFMHIEVPEGTKAAYVDGESITDVKGVITEFPGERELIIQRGTTFYVRNVEVGDDGKPHIYAEIRRQEH